LFSYQAQPLESMLLHRSSIRRLIQTTQDEGNS